MMTRLGYAIRSSVPSLSGRDAMTMTLAQARTILDKTLAAAREKKLKPLGIAVVDSRGALRAYAEEDGNPILRSKIASGKAFGSVAFGSGSRRLLQIGVERPHMAAALIEMCRAACSSATSPGHCSVLWAYPATPPTTTRRRRSPASRRPAVAETGG